MKWAWRYMDLWNNLGFSLCAALSVCYIIGVTNLKCYGSRLKWLSQEITLV